MTIKQKIKTLFVSDRELLYYRIRFLVLNKTPFIPTHINYHLAYLIQNTLNILKFNFLNKPEIFVEFGPRDLLKEIWTEIGDWRNLYRVLFAFSEAGYYIKILLPLTINEYLNSRYMRGIFSIKNVKFVNAVPGTTESKTYVTSADNRHVNSRKWRKKIIINFDISSMYSSSCRPLVISYGMHMQIYKYKKHKKLNCYINNRNRPVRIFSLGGHGGESRASLEKYGKSRFGKLSRSRIFQTINQYLSDDKKLIVDNSVKFYQLFNRRAKLTQKLVIFAFYRYSIEWLKILSMSDFFLCAPGYWMPMCHSSNEAMAVGTIPLINSPEWFSPPLEDMENCVVFNNESELIDKIQLIFEMTPEQVSFMRENVIKYYKDHLSSIKLMEKLKASEEKELEVFFISEANHHLNKINSKSVIHKF